MLLQSSMSSLLARCCAGGWELEPRSPELSRPAEAAGAAAAEGSALPAHLFAYPLESNFSGARCAAVPNVRFSLGLQLLQQKTLHRQHGPLPEARFPERCS